MITAQNKWLRLANRLVLAMAAALAAGCAVLTVDVDVYKGPLVNERQVQVQQVAVMAIGAKPLLTQYRDEFERAVARGDALREFEDRRKRTTEAGRSAVGTAYEFENPRAKLVNDVLSLYDDQSSNPAVAKLLADLRRSLEGYASARAILRPDSPTEERRALVERLGLREPADRLTRPLLSDPVSPADAPAAIAMARQAYFEMLLPRRVDGRYYFYDEDRAVANGRFRRDDRLKPLDQQDADARFDVLADASFVSADAEELFPNANPEDRAEFVRTIVQIAQSFATARRAMEQALVAALSIPKAMECLDSRPVDACKMQSLVSVVAYLIDIPEINRQTTGDREPRLPALGVPEFTLLPTIPTIRLPVAENNEQQNRTTFREVLRQLAMQNPGKLAGELLELHQLIKKGERGPVKRHGLAVGPLKDISLDALRRAEIELAAELGDFSGGRPADGIETLIDRFVRASPPPPDFARIEQELFDGLIHFAEKLLFVAQNSLFVSNMAKPTNPVDAFGASTPSESLDLIEAVGNQILVQVNELRAQDNFKARDRAEWARQNHANPSAANGDSRSPSTTVLDRLIADLDREHRNALASGDTGRAANTVKALEAAREQRAARVYIRPPSFYLKNSYPATSLQNNSAAGAWEDMLGRHAMRSIPFINENTANGGNAGLNRAKQRQSIDQQFWQNVNRVRVAGAGRTNYVIVKDDVGNWYVQNYGADPRDIINAARKAGTLLIGVPPLADVSSSGVPGTSGPASAASATLRRPSVSSTQIAFFVSRYEQRVVEHLAAIDTLIRRTDNKTLSERIVSELKDDPASAAVFANADADTPAAFQVRRELEQIEQAWPTDLPTKTNDRTAVLNSVMGKMAAVCQPILSSAPAGTPNEAAVKIAVMRTLDRELLRPVKEVLAKRKAAAEEFADAIKSLGDAAGAFEGQ